MTLNCMFNINYFINSLFFIIPRTEFEFLFIVGISYLLHDYFIILLSYFKDFVYLSAPIKEELKFTFIILISIAILF